MTLRFGLLALIEAQPGKGAELGSALEGARAIATRESGTVTWYAFRIGETSYGVFDTFETEEARLAHLGGDIPKALASIRDDLLAKDPDIRNVDLLAVK